jgi:hypothetical protein
MPRSFSPDAVIVLPRISVADAIALAAKLEGVALPPKPAGKGKAPKKPTLTPAIKAALSEVKKARETLEKEAARIPEKPVLVRQADLAEDTAVGALYDVLKGWARLPSSVAGADAARRVIEKMFADGVAFVMESVDREWAIVQGKLHNLDAETQAGIALVGATPILQHLRTVHATYGDVIGVTAPRAFVVESPHVRKKLDALRAALRDYVLKVAASIDKKKLAATTARRDLLLAPVMAMEPPPVARKPSTAKAKPAKGAAAGATAAPSDGSGSPA